MGEFAYAMLWLFIFSVPWQNILTFPGLGTISHAAGFAAMGVTLVVVLLSGHLRRPGLFHLVALCLVLWAGTTIAWSMDRSATVQRFATYVQLLGLAWLVWELGATRGRWAGLMQAYILGAYVSALDTILNFHHGAGRHLRFAASGFNPNDLGFTLVLALPMAWYLATSTHGTVARRWLNRAYLPIGAVAILLTGSRGALVAGLVAFLIVPWSLPRMSLATNAAMGAMLGLMAVVAVRYVPTTSWARLETTQDEIENGTMNDRRVIWHAGITVFPEHPVRGVGLGAFSTAVEPYLGHEKTAHNSYLSLMVEQGAVGLALFLLMFLSALLHARRVPMRERRMFLVLLLTLGIGLLSRTGADNKYTWFILSLPLAAFEAIRTADYAPRRVAADG